MNVACDYSGPFNTDPVCPTNLSTLFAGDGQRIGVVLGTDPMITFFATVDSPTTATLMSYVVGNDQQPTPTPIPITGAISLEDGGRVLVISPQGSPPFSVPVQSNGQEHPCYYTQYIGTFTQITGGQTGGGAVQPIPLAPLPALRTVQQAALEFAAGPVPN